jgi:nucleotide-binding universal stress UspA family protein
MFHKILVALDKSSASRRVLDEAIVLARSTNAAVMLLHVFSSIEDGYPSPMLPGVDGVYYGLHEQVVEIYTEQWQQLEQQELAWLKTLATEAINAGVSTEFTQNVGDPGRTICQIAQTWSADLIMLGRQGRSGLTEFFLGSVSNYVLHHAPCSVLTVQGQLTPETSHKQDAADSLLHPTAQRMNSTHVLSDREPKHF